MQPIARAALYNMSHVVHSWLAHILRQVGYTMLLLRAIIFGSAARYMHMCTPFLRVHAAEGLYNTCSMVWVVL